MTLLATLRPRAGAGDAGPTLADLAAELGDLAPAIEGDASVRIRDVRQDSRAVEPGELFVARAGASANGAAFAADAARRGAAAVLAAHDAELPPLGVPVLRVRDPRRALAFAAEAVHGFPSRKLALVGVTGTNGKTTTSFLLEHALGRLGARPARLGTLGAAFDGVTEETLHTTPEADAISRWLASVVRRSGTHAVMEVSSHALSLDRVAALRFDVAAFTNLTQDHLDFYASMAEYGRAKARLFLELGPRASVLNVDDAFGAGLAARAPGAVTRVSRGEPADVAVLGASLGRDGVRAELSVRGRPVTLASPLVGAHNLDNLLLALGVLDALGHDAEASASALAGAPGVPGRLERCDAPDDGVLVVVDYAHTPDALERVLSALRPITPGALACVFGCGGDRDPGKRPKMGAAVARGADFAVVTNDNPRGEDPERIAAAIVPPLAASGTRFAVELDRALAIERAILGAAPGDTVLVAGKGHETYQIFRSETRAFDDRVEARRALALRRARGGS